MAGPLTLEDKKSIDKALELTAQTEKDIARAELAGIDVAAQKATLAQSKQRLLAIRQAYFPAGR